MRDALGVIAGQPRAGHAGFLGRNSSPYRDSARRQSGFVWRRGGGGTLGWGRWPIQETLDKSSFAAISSRARDPNSSPPPSIKRPTPG